VFFAEAPEDPPSFDQVQRFYDSPEALPEHWLPGSCDVRAVLARTHDAVVTFRVAGCFPRGLELEVRAFTAPPAQTDAPVENHPHRWAGDDLRIGLLCSDGRRAEKRPDHVAYGRPGAPDPAPDELTLTMCGGSGGGLTYDFRFWLHPLPPPGPAQLYLRWDARGIPETSIEVDLSPAVAAAADAQELWHLPTFEEDPPEGGWFAYAPYGGGITAATFAATARDDGGVGSGDALDAGDEDR